MAGSYRGIPISPGIPMDLGEPHIAKGNGDPHPHITSDIGMGIPIIGGPHITATPVPVQ